MSDSEFEAKFDAFLVAIERIAKSLETLSSCGVRPSAPAPLTTQGPLCLYKVPLPGFSGICPHCKKDTTEIINKIRSR